MKTGEITFDVADETAQMAIGAHLAETLDRRSGVLYLRGDLGAGKTTLVRGLLRGLGYSGPARSPTYTLIEPYDDLEPPVAHLDLYRLGDPEELDYLGFRDLLERPCLLAVEWPERGRGVLPAADLEITIEHAGNGRHLSIRSAPDWVPMLNAMSGLTAPGVRRR